MGVAAGGPRGGREAQRPQRAAERAGQDAHDEIFMNADDKRRMTKTVMATSSRKARHAALLDTTVRRSQVAKSTMIAESCRLGNDLLTTNLSWRMSFTKRRGKRCLRMTLGTKPCLPESALTSHRVDLFFVL